MRTKRRILVLFAGLRSHLNCVSPPTLSSPILQRLAFSYSTFLSFTHEATPHNITLLHNSNDLTHVRSDSASPRNNNDKRQTRNILFSKRSIPDRDCPTKTPPASSYLSINKSSQPLSIERSSITSSQNAVYHHHCASFGFPGTCATSQTPTSTCCEAPRSA